MIFKNLEEVLQVVALGKPIEVVESFLDSYFQGIAYDAWADGKDLEEVDDDGNLVNVYEPIDSTAQIAQWKLDNYAELRAPLYPNPSVYLDAMVKGDTNAMDQYIQDCLDVKTLFPKG